MRPTGITEPAGRGQGVASDLTDGESVEILDDGQRGSDGLADEDPVADDGRVEPDIPKAGRGHGATNC